MSSLVFLDVDDPEKAVVRAAFPDAVFESEHLADAEIISTFITTPFPRDVIERLPNLKLLCTRSVGYDHIDMAACKEKGILVCNVPDYGSHVIAEHVFALLLGTLRHIFEGTKRVRDGVFEYRGLKGMALRDKTLGVVGTGKIGKRVVEIAHGFGMRILATDVYQNAELVEKYGVKYVDREVLLVESDIITLHAPSLPATRHMIDAKALALMKDGVIIVNTARGSLIESTALLAALNSGKVAYALLDVLEHESNVGGEKTLIHHPRVVTTPHIAFYADDSVRTMYADSIESIKQWKRGEKPTHLVSPS